MKKKDNQVSKNKWKRIIQKKWFFPALYLTVTALLLTGVLWYQNANQTSDIDENLDQLAEDFTEQVPYDDEVQAVMEQQETIKMPVKDEKNIEVITKFFDYDADKEDQESALIEYNNRFYQSTGIDLATEDGEAFDVVAAISGTVVEVKDDPILGNVVVLEHDHEIKTYYASLQDVSVDEGDELSQGDLIGTAGSSLFGKDKGKHVHFELRKTGTEVNPEEFFNQPLSKLANYVFDEVDRGDEESEEDSMADPIEDSPEDTEAEEQDNEETED